MNSNGFPRLFPLESPSLDDENQYRHPTRNAPAKVIETTTNASGGAAPFPIDRITRPTGPPTAHVFPAINAACNPSFPRASSPYASPTVVAAPNYPSANGSAVDAVSANPTPSP